MLFKRFLIILVLMISACSTNIPFDDRFELHSVGAVVSADSLATDAGLKILKGGGNAVDAAVAVGFTLAVTYPRAGNLGGGGFMVLRLSAGSKTTIDFREKAPELATRDMYLDSAGNHIPELSEEGVLSAGVPGSVAGMLYALDKYGTMTVEELILPSYKLAKEGIIVTSGMSETISERLGIFQKYPATSSIFLKDSLPYKVGDSLIQSDLSETLMRIMEEGAKGFYEGKTAELFVSTIKKHGGLITISDLRAYRSVERVPVIGNYRGYEIIGMQPPSSGGIVLTEMLNILENFDISGMGIDSYSFIRMFTEAAKYAYADRAAYLGDMDFYHVPLNALTAKEYAQPKADSIKSGKIIPSKNLKYGKETWLDSVENTLLNESTETTHYSVIDKWGNAVSVSTTINAYYGSKIVVDGAGFFLNNEMDDFAAKPGVPNMYGLVQGEANLVEPGKRMLSSMTPTIVEKNGKVVLITGSPGGSRIITTIAQVLINYIDFKMDPVEAVKRPRIHHQWLPDILYYEPDALDSEMKLKLESSGYELKERAIIGTAQTIGWERSTGRLVPAPDMRRTGYGGIVEQ